MQSLPKSLFVFVFCVPLAIVLGVVLATPMDRTTMLIVFGVILLLISPILLTSHHTILILSWNAYVNAFFLPGQPYFWMLATAMSCFFVVLVRTLNRGRIPLLNVPSITWPLITLAILSYVVSQMTGGVGAQAVGSSIYGGKRYFFLWCAVVGYFALSNFPIEEKKRQLLAGLFFLSAATAVFSNIAFMLGERFYFLFLLFPVDWAIAQAASEYVVGGFSRVGGLGPASLALGSYALLRWGIRGIFNVRYPWRLGVLVFAAAIGLFSGFRAILLLTLLQFAIQFFLEGLHKTKYLMILGFGTMLLGAAILPFANRMPLAVQRCLTLFPLDLDRAAVEAARGSTDWRIEMWKAVVPDITRYLIWPKGFAIDPKDLYFAQQNISLRTYAPYEASLIAGDYHNGPLTLIIPFGIWGVLVFTWFCIAALRLLWRNYRYGEESVLNINTFLLTAFIAKLSYFLLVFGAFYLDLAAFTGILALSVSINRGMASPVPAPALVPARIPAEPEPGVAPEVWQPAFARRRLQTW